MDAVLNMILILAALKEEVKPILAEMEVSETVNLRPAVITRGTYLGKEVVVACEACRDWIAVGRESGDRVRGCACGIGGEICDLAVDVELDDVAGSGRLAAGRQVSSERDDVEIGRGIDAGNDRERGGDGIDDDGSGIATA